MHFKTHHNSTFFHFSFLFVLNISLLFINFFFSIFTSSIKVDPWLFRCSVISGRGFGRPHCLVWVQLWEAWDASPWVALVHQAFTDKTFILLVPLTSGKLNFCWKFLQVLLISSCPKLWYFLLKEELNATASAWNPEFSYCETKLLKGERRKFGSALPTSPTFSNMTSLEIWIYIELCYSYSRSWEIDHSFLQPGMLD